ncbi:hypothetical protein [Paenibacillus tritici]|nr:hypothetical protein [Paenibacillus tritici]
MTGVEDGELRGEPRGGVGEALTSSPGKQVDKRILIRRFLEDIRD